MKLLSKIVGKPNVLRICFTADGEAALSFDVAKKALAKSPLVAVVSGKGVITKDMSAGNVVETVTSDPGTFLWTIAGGKISFVRREQLAPVTEELEKENIRPLYMECLPGTGGQALAGVLERFRSEHLGWKKILKPSTEGSALALLVAKRLRLPILGTLMLILAANFAVSSRVRDNFGSANAELAAIRRHTSAATVSNDQKQAVIEQFSHRLPYRASRLSDVIAAATPEKVTLNELAIAPLLRAPETGKPVQQSERKVVIRGETPTSEAVTEFTEALGKFGIGVIQLASVEQDKDRAVLTFRIEITL